MSDKPPPAGRVVETNWDTLRRTGQQTQAVLLASLPPEEIRRLRGPALRKWSNEKASPLSDRAEPLRILLGPDLDPADTHVQLLANLGHIPQVRVYADPELAERLKPIATEPWSVETKEHYLLGRWGSGANEMQAGLTPRPYLEMSLARHVLGDDFQKLSGPVLNRYAQAVEFQQSTEGPMHMMATRVPNAVALRATRTGLWSTGFVSPEEALLVALIIQHHHDRFVSKSEPGFIEKPEAFGWYSGLAQLALPRYLPLFSRQVDKLERADRVKQRGYVGGRLFDSFQGVFKRVRQLLRIHDQLAWLQLLESRNGSNLRLMLQQSDLVFEAVSAIKSALDGFAVMLVTKAQIRIDAERERVGFADIRWAGKPWRNQFGSYQPVVDAIEPSISQLLDRALELRRVGTHYHPLDGVRLTFNQWIEGVNQDGTARLVPASEETAGAIMFAPRRETAGLTYGQDGLLPFESETYALPWSFVRGLVRDTIRLLSSLLDQIAAVEGVHEAQAITYFRPSPYARFELELHRQISLGTVLVVLVVAIGIFIGRKNFGEAAIAFVAGLFPALSIDWTAGKFVAFCLGWILLAGLALIIGSVRLASQDESIYTSAAIAIKDAPFSGTVKRLRQISGSYHGPMGPVEKARVLRLFAYRGIAVENMGRALADADKLATVTRLDNLVSAGLVGDLFRMDSALPTNHLDAIEGAILQSASSPSEFVSAFNQSRHVALSGKVDRSAFLQKLADFLRGGYSPEQIGRSW